MSHFTVLVINTKGEKDVKSQLDPYWELDLPEDELKEDPRSTFEDNTDEYRKEYDEDTRREFYCDSSSSWGMQILEELFKKIKESSIGREFVIEVVKSIVLGGYYKLNGKYRGYHEITGVDEEGNLKHGMRCEGDAWHEVIEIVESNHPDENTCFEGKVRIKVIEPPKDISHKTVYETFEEFCEEWHDATLNEDGRVGWWHNEDAQWDWYQIGGRWAGMLLLKDNVQKEEDPNFSWGWDDVEKAGILNSNKADSALKKEIDWEAMRTVEKYDDACRYWEMKVDGDSPKNDHDRKLMEDDWYNTKYFIDKYKTKDVYAECMASFTTYAVLLDGEWLAAGKMGWMFTCRP